MKNKLPKWKNKWGKDNMKDLIKKILKEEIISENFQSISYGNLSDDDKKNIKESGVKIFDKFKLANFEKLNDFFKEHGLFYGTPDKEYLQNNSTHIEFALDYLPLTSGTKDNLREKQSRIMRQLESIEKFERGELPTKGRHFEFFHEIPKKEEEKMVWSIVNLFDNNIKLWIKLINDWLSSAKRTKKITSVSGLINHYFGINNGRKAFTDLIHAMVDRVNHSENIIKKTWGGGQEIEKSFTTKLLSNNFNENDIHIFSGEKNIVDGIGIDLAVKCEGRWIPIQVKSNQGDAYAAIPYQGFATFPYGNTFMLVSKLKNNKVQRKLSDLCKPLDNPIEDIPVKLDKPVRGTPPPNVDYLGWMEKQK